MNITVFVKEKNSYKQLHLTEEEKLNLKEIPEESVCMIDNKPFKVFGSFEDPIDDLSYLVYVTSLIPTKTQVEITDRVKGMITRFKDEDIEKLIEEEKHRKPAYGARGPNLDQLDNEE